MSFGFPGFDEMIARELLETEPLDADNECSCDELLIKGRRVPMPPGHDCDYIARRNALIPQAEKIASAKVATARGDGKGTAAWTRAFSIAMDELSRPLLNGSHQAESM
jgi:hypothetical protein